MEKQLTLEQFKKRTKFKIRSQHNPNKLSRETYHYNREVYGDGIDIESVECSDILSNYGGNLQKATKSAFTVFSYMLDRKVTVRIKFEECVVVEDED